MDTSISINSMLKNFAHTKIHKEKVSSDSSVCLFWSL